MISVVILTYNEERNISRCLDSVRWCDDVLVFDSCSTDKTTEFARDSGARVIEHPFENYGKQREAARKLGDYKYDWVLSLDADETPDERLVKEMLDISQSSRERHNAFRMRRKDFFLGRWIKHSTLYPSWFVRFYKHQVVHYDDRAVHEYPIVKGAIGELRGHLLHDNFSKGMDHWWQKHLRYAALEASENARREPFSVRDLPALLSRDPVCRRRALKRFSMELPCRPFLRFLYMYFLRLGLLDGSAGYKYCRLLADYERVIVARTRELQAR